MEPPSTIPLERGGLVVPLFALPLALLIASQGDQELSFISIEDVPNQPFANLLEQKNAEDYSKDEFGALRARIEQERDEKLAAAKKTEEGWKKTLAADRRELEAVNKQSSSDTEEDAKRRSSLHIEIAALERGIRDKKAEQEHSIPAAYELKLSKVWLAKHWPERRSEILREIEEGRGRARRHGDVEDIGYRKLVKDSEKDIETGKQAARQMMAGGWLPAELKNEEVQSYVRRLGSKLATNSDLKVPLHVVVLDSAELRAIALPGGFLYVTSGVIRAAQTESELAGVLSREIARIAARHATRTSNAAWISRLFVPVAQIVVGAFTGGPVNPGAYYGIGYGIEGASTLLKSALNGEGAAHQREADQLGVQYAWKAGFDPRGLVTFLDSIAGKGDDKFLSTEPSLEKRMLNLFSEIQYLPAQGKPTANSEEFDRIKQIVAG
jgi:Peptidase family M48